MYLYGLNLNNSEYLNILKEWCEASFQQTTQFLCQRYLNIDYQSTTWWNRAATRMQINNWRASVTSIRNGQETRSLPEFSPKWNWTRRRDETGSFFIHEARDRKTEDLNEKCYGWRRRSVTCCRESSDGRRFNNWLCVCVCVCVCVCYRAGSADSVLPVWGDDTRLLHAGLHRQLHRQRAGHVSEGGAGEGGRWVVTSPAGSSSPSPLICFHLWLFLFPVRTSRIGLNPRRWD